MATAKFGRIGRYHSDSLFKLESLEAADLGDITVGYGTVANGRVYILSQQADIGNNLCFVNNPGTRELSITLGSSIYINGSEINQTSASAVFSTIYDDVAVISRVAYIFENGDYNFFAGNYPTHQRPIIINGQPAILDVSECYLHLLKNGNYVMLNQQVADNTEVYLIDSTPDNPPTITEVSVFVGTYGAYTHYDFEIIDGEYSIRIVPELLEFQKNSGTHEIPWDTYEPEFILNGEPARISAGTTAPFFPENSGLTSIGFPDLMLVLDTDNNTANEFTLRFNVGNGFGTADSLIRVVGDEPNPNPYNPGGVSRPGGGGGSFDGGPTDDPTILIPNGTTEDNASLSRIYTRYVLDSSDLSIVGNRLWTTDIINDIVNAIATLFASPFESIISLLSFPFDISSMQGYSAARQIMMWGNVQFISDGLFDVPQTAAVSFDWGEISIESFYDGFLDYAPYTKMELYLPWGTGVVSIDPNECTPGKIRIRSNIELDKGTAVHIVTSEFTRDGRTVKEVLGTYGTVVGKQIPITALDYAGKSHAVASVAVTAGAIALAGGAGAAVSSSAGALTSGASTTALSTAVSPAQLAPIATTAMPPLMYNAPRSEEFKITPESVKLATEGINAAMTPGHVARNGSFMTGSAGLLPTTPFLIISRPEQSVPENYGHYYGYPSNIYSKLSDLSGFTQVGSIHLENIVCTEKEREELMTLLQGGVLL